MEIYVFVKQYAEGYTYIFTGSIPCFEHSYSRCYQRQVLLGHTLPPGLLRRLFDLYQPAGRRRK